MLGPWDLVATRYETSRQLRTRATGTPFRVRFEDGLLVITTTSGSDRAVSRKELEASWPFLERDAPRSAWKHLSNNGSYLDSVFDDIREMHSTQTQAVPALNGAQSQVAIAVELGIRDEEIRDLHNALTEQRDLEAEVQELKTRLQAHARESATAQADFATAAHESTIETGRLKRRVRELERSLADAGTTVGHEVTAQRDKALADSYTSKLRVADLTQQLERAELLAKEASTRLAASKAHAKPATVTTLEIRYDIGQLVLKSSKEMPSAVAASLAASAPKVFRDPDASIGECRRALETVARILWTRSGSAAPPDRWMDLMDGLRGSPLVPISDWHLMRNLYSRASGVVHDGGATPDIALWIWLGVAQAAQLAGVAPSKQEKPE